MDREEVKWAIYEIEKEKEEALNLVKELDLILKELKNKL